MAWGLAGVAVLLALIAFALPVYLRGVLQERLSASLHRSVSVDRVRINPLALSATLHGLTIAGRGAEPPVLKVDRIYARLGLSSILHATPVIAALRIEHPQVQFARLAPHRYSISDILDPLLNAPPSNGPPSRFALYNVELTEGDLRFDDRPVGRRQHVEHLDVAIPFISNIPAEEDVLVQPHVVAVVDGTRFELRGRAKVFAPTPEATLQLTLAPVDLVQFLPYLPVKPGLTLAQGRLATALTVSFRQPHGRPPSMHVAGTMQALGWRVVSAEGAPLGQFERVAVDLAALDLTARQAQVRGLDVEGLGLTLSRDAKGGLNWLHALAALPAPKGPPATQGPAASAPSTPVGASAPWAWRLERFSLTRAALNLSDASVTPHFELRLNPIDLELRGLSSRLNQAADLRLAVVGDGGETLNLLGRLAPNPLAGSGELRFGGIRPARAAAYLAPLLPGINIDDGVLQGRVPFQLTPNELPTLRDAELVFSAPALRLTGAGQPFFKAQALTAAGIVLDGARRHLSLGRLSLDAPTLAAARDEAGRVDVLALGAPASAASGPLRTGAAPAASAPVVAASVPVAPEVPWRYDVAQLELSKGVLAYEDHSQTTPLRLTLKEMGLAVQGLGNTPGQAAALQFQTRWGERGHLAVKGRLKPAPLQADLAINGQGLDVVPLVAQVVANYAVSVTRARLSARGALNLDLSGAKPNLAWKGDVAVTDFDSIDLLNDTDFVRWKQFALTHVDARSEPLSVGIGDVVLSDFQTRLILSKEGALNLREVTRERNAVGPPAPGASLPVASVASAPAPAGAPASTPLPPLRIDRITLSGGQIEYSDRFVKPNFDAHLTQVGGTITNLGTDPQRIAALQMRAEVDDDAPVDLNGQFAPFRNDRYLDLKASVKGYELTNLSAYSGKYVGYDIEKGKLSLDLRYTITNRTLSADNHLMLDQLTFGDKVESPDATSLPVRFAVSLLKNSRGEIDVNLPVGGTLDDPQFSIGGLVWRMIGNFFKRIITSPFSFFGGGEAQGELSMLSFTPGSEGLTPDALKKLDTIAKALRDRSSLKLEIAGCADAADLDGLKQNLIGRKLRTLKLREMARKGESGGSIAELQIDPAEYPKLLAQVYQEEKFPKPRNLLGLAKDLPVAEMEKLILANASVGDSEVRALALARGSVVKTWLEDVGHVPPERLFVLAPKLEAEAVKEGATAQRVDFSLR